MSNARSVEGARSALMADPTRAQNWILYLEALVSAGAFAEARKTLDLAQRKGLKSVDMDRIQRLLKNEGARVSSEPKGQQPPSRDADALFALLDANRIAELEKQALAMTQRFPDSELGWTMLGAAFTLQNRPAQSLEPMERAVTLAPGNARALNNLGRTFIQLGRYSDAEEVLRIAIERKPGLAEAVFLLGVSLQGQGRSAEAEGSFRKVLRGNPHDAQALTNLGIALLDQGNLAEAEKNLHHAISCKPELPNPHHTLGSIYLTQRRLPLAEQSLRRAVQLAPNNPDAYVSLSEVLRLLDQGVEALVWMRRAVELQPNNPALLLELGNLQAQLDHWLDAENSYRTSLKLLPEDFRARTNLANVLASLGKLEEASEEYRRSLQQSPQNSGTFHALLFCANYHPDKPAEEVYAAYEDYERQFGAPLREQWMPHLNASLQAGAVPAAPHTPPARLRRLRIGYVSPDLRQHSVRHFLEPLLASHDRSRFEVFAYAELAVEDVATARYRTYCDHFILTRGMSDEELAARIRADAIDILVDLAGHTAGNRLLTFARKPAPVSLSWMGYGYTTGLKAIDHLLTDEASAPAGSEHLFSEAPWRLPGGAYVFRPDSTMGEVSPLPALSNGFVTFGTLSRAIRINHRTVRVWAEILKRVPGSRLVIDSKNFQHASMQDAMAERFAQHGIARERLLIGCHSPPWDTLRSMDIGLDCFPHNSGTTLFESLFMGVPFITFAGRPSVGRLGKSILTSLGHPQWMDAWCAASEEDYIDKATALASDLPALAQIRQELRPQMQRGALMDQAGFARSVEQAYLQMFERRQTRQVPSSAAQEARA